MSHLFSLRTAPALIGLLLLAVFGLQNSGSINVNVLWMELTLRKAELIGLSALLGFLVGIGVALFWRVRKH